MNNINCISSDNCKTCASRVAWIGVWTNVLMVILKLFIGYTSGSKACIADGLHSASNIITALAILVSHRYTKKLDSEEFPYGFGKIEFLAASFVSLLIIVGALSLITISVHHLLANNTEPPHFSAIVMAVISIGANEMLYRYMRCVGTSINSQTVMANAWSNRADCFSSFAVIIGVVGAKLGIPHLDAITALLVVAVIVKISLTILFESVKSLMDVSVNDKYGEDIKDTVHSVEGVQGLSNLKTRQVGHYVWAEMDIHIDPLYALRDGYHIGQMVRDELLVQIADLDKIIIHYRPTQQEEEESEDEVESDAEGEELTVDS
jgi:cation diffusion facilitator family transporter